MSNGTICCVVRACCPEAEQREAVAKMLHESGREAVARGAVVNKVPGQPFYSWERLTEEAREGRRLMADYVLARVDLVPKGVGAAIVELYGPLFKHARP